MKRLLFSLAILVTAAAAFAAPDDDPKALVAAAKELAQARRYADALQSFEKALAAAQAGGDAITAAHAKLGIARVQLMRNDVDAALALAEEARATFEAAGDRDGTAQALSQSAAAHVGASQHALANELLRKALSFADDAKRRAIILEHLGANEIALGHHREAMDALREAVAIAEQGGDFTTVAAAYHGMAVVHAHQANADLAAFYEEKALAIARERKNLILISQSLNSLASIYDLQGDFERAIALYRENLALLESRQYTRGIIITRLNISDVLIHLGRHDEAEAMIRAGLADLETFQIEDVKANALRGLSTLYELRGDNQAALTAALESARQRTEDWRDVYASQTLIGHLERKLGRTAEARAALDRAVQLAETTRALASGEAVHFFDERSDAYVEMAALLVGEGDVEGALAYAERYRSRVLIDLLQTLPADRARKLSEIELARERELVERLSKLQTEAARGATDALSERLTTARREYDAFQHDLADAHPRLRVERGTLDPVSIAQAMSRLPSDTVLVEYLVAQDKTYAFVIADGSIRVLAIDVARDEVARQSQAFHDLLARRRPDFRKNARVLYQQLVAPIAELVAKRTWILVPDGPLWNLPFQALVDVRGRYVGQDAAIVYAPSIAAWMEMGRSGEASSRRNRRELLAFGNPTTPAGADPERTRSKLNPLPEAEAEVRSAARSYGAGSAVYVRDEATEERFKAEASHYRVLHLAGHGVLNDASPMHSYLLLAARDGGPEDGYLEAGELMQMDLGAELVVLSACETARGKYAAGEGIIGFSWALFAARCRTQVVSQWKVDSAATSVLMRAFHENVRGDRHRAASALRKSVASMLKTKEYRHPFYWAGFIVLGDAR